MNTTTRWTILASVGAIVVSSATIRAQQPPANIDAPSTDLGPLTDDEFRLEVDKTAATEIDRLVPMLGSPKYAEREQATERLVEIGAKAFARLRDAFHGAEDLEVRLGVESVVRKAYLNRYVFDKNGFLGVSLGLPDAPNIQRTPQPPQPRTTSSAGVRISNVVPNTAASRAGLQVDDIVTGMNGVPFRGVGQDAIEHLRQTIRRLIPGTKVRLSVTRGGAPIVVDVVIGRCDEETARRTSLPFTNQYDQVSSRFLTWWSKYFAVQAGTASSSRP